jgi:hypothetical protein
MRGTGKSERKRRNEREGGVRGRVTEKKRLNANLVFLSMILPLLSAVDVVVTALLSSHAENVPVTCPSFCMKM